MQAYYVRQRLSSGCFCPHFWAPSLPQITQFRMLLPSIWAPSSLPNNSVQDVSVLTSGLHPRCQIPQFRMLLPWAPSSLPNTSVQAASVLTSGLHPHCQILQFRMLLSSLLGSILTAKYFSSGCFCPHVWAPSSLPNTSVQDASVLTSGLHPHCRKHC